MNKQGLFIHDIDGEIVEVTDLDRAIEQCEFCKESLFKMKSGHTVGENHKYMLRQLLEIEKRQKNS